MTKTTKKTKIAPISTKRLTVIPGIPCAVAMEHFRKTLIQEEDSKNDDSAKFLSVADGILNNQRSFSLSDFVYQCSVYNIDGRTTKILFDKFTDYLSQIGKLSAVRGCYDDEIFIVQ
jgi:hypothetical protein